jgi:hypothetical protein
MVTQAMKRVRAALEVRPAGHTHCSRASRASMGYLAPLPPPRRAAPHFRALACLLHAAGALGCILRVSRHAAAKLHVRPAIKHARSPHPSLSSAVSKSRGAQNSLSHAMFKSCLQDLDSGKMVNIEEAAREAIDELFFGIFVSF